MKRLLLIFLYAALALWSCSKPDREVMFIKEKDAAGGVYEFGFAMNDTLASYDISFYTRVAGSWKESIRLDVEWIAPDGKKFDESVFFGPSDDYSGFVEAYRTGVVPVVPGDWTIKVKTGNVPKGFWGLGLMCEENGTR